MFAGFMKPIPLEIEEAAVIDGRSPLQTYSRIVLPVSNPTMISVGILETIKDLAEKSRHSVAAVSRVLNHHPNASNKAREEINCFLKSIWSFR